MGCKPDENPDLCVNRLDCLLKSTLWHAWSKRFC